MALPQGIAFRTTLGYVTDAANDWAELSHALDYPTTTTQGNTVGWESAPGSVIDTRNRSTSVPRLAGTAFNTSAGLATFRIDLPSSGNYNINLAAGDAVYAANTKIELFDTTTSLGVLCSGNTGAGNSFKDAANNTRTASNWVSTSTNGGTAAAATFSTTICRFKDADGTNNCQIAYFRIESAGGGGGISLPSLAARTPIIGVGVF